MHIMYYFRFIYSTFNKKFSVFAKQAVHKYTLNIQFNQELNSRGL